jgi:hypothetical protein
MKSRAGMKSAFAVSLVILTLSSCVVAPDQEHRVDGRVMVAPPPPREEVVATPPDSGSVWIAGYWRWIGGRYEWQPGHFVRGRPGYHWVAHSWVREGDGWRLHEGHWVRG